MPPRLTSGTELAKCPTGITGLDEITNGGIPRGRPTLICGGPGCGKTLFGIEFLVNGAKQGEPGVFVAFEERPEELAQNVTSLGFDLNRLQKQKKLFVEYLHIERSEIDETGEYDLDALFFRLADAVDSVGAKRIVLDTLETLFSGFSNEAILRAELRRLFRWLKDRGLTAVITAERGDGALTRQGLEEYVSDCVIVLDHRLSDQVATRRLRVLKYRGTQHGTNEYPFLIDRDGIDVLPITSIGLSHDAPTERISTGIADLDEMLAGGVYRGSTVLISGTAGAGKSSISAHVANATCERGERCLLFTYEESPQQIMRNMRTIGIDLAQYVRKGLLHCIATRPTNFGLEMHLATIHKAVRDYSPNVLIVDPITNFFSIADPREVKAMLMRLVDFLKAQQITAVMTSLTGGGQALEATEAGISSLIDTWLLLRDVELNGERNRAMYVLKSRGTAHSNQLREFVLTPNGVKLIEPYLGPEGVLTGSSRVAQEAKASAAALQRQQEAARKRREIERRMQTLDTEIAALRLQISAESDELERLASEESGRQQQIAADRTTMALSRKSTATHDAPRAPRRRQLKREGIAQ
ncbi:MAG TPA: circadian clock protein KaiC [Thermoanaerobaculia bacterium]|jgi:circadian clock protein KaiC|nr:circadian clock protein KaiC [Thermoanaerobaculia bacterium]